VPRRRWPLANLLLLVVGCTASNPAYRPQIVDGGEVEHDSIDSLAPRDEPQDATLLDLRQGDGASLDVPAGRPDLNAGEAANPPDDDARPVVPDAGPPGPDAPADLSTPPADMNPVPVGTGLLAHYFDGFGLEKGDTGALVLQRVDSTIDFDWGTGRVLPDIDDDYFSVRWTGQVMPLHSEPYTFRTVSDEGVRLWVNGTQLIDSWVTQQSVSRTGTVINLQAFQRYDIRLEYFEQTGTASVHLYWSSPSQPSQIVPRACLFAP
jgi:hypothetical protein